MSLLWTCWTHEMKKKLEIPIQYIISKSQIENRKYDMAVVVDPNTADKWGRDLTIYLALTLSN